MFELLDDDEPFVADEAFVAGVRRRGRTLRRRRRSLATGVVLAPVVLAGTAVGWVDRRLARVDRVDVEVGGPAPLVDGVPSEPVDVLVVGTDAGLHDAAGEPDGLAGPPGSPRADAVALVRLDPTAGEVRILSLPRDLVAPGADGARLASIRANAGPAGLTAAVTELLAARGVDDGIDAYVELDAHGLARITDLAGGVAVAARWPLRDAQAGLALDAGCHVLDGTDVVALVRSRRLEVADEAGWTIDTSGDLGRIERSQLVGRALADALLDLEPSATSMLSLVELVADHLTLDQATAVDELAGWATWARGLPAQSIAVRTLPAAASSNADGSAVLATTDEATSTLRWWHDGGPPPAPAAPTEPGRAPTGAVSVPLEGRCP